MEILNKLLHNTIFAKIYGTCRYCNLINTFWKALALPVLQFNVGPTLHDLIIIDDVYIALGLDYTTVNKLAKGSLRRISCISKAWFPYGRNGRKDWVAIFLISRNTTFYNWKYAEWLRLENTYDLTIVYTCKPHIYS